MVTSVISGVELVVTSMMVLNVNDYCLASECNCKMQFFQIERFLLWLLQLNLKKV